MEAQLDLIDLDVNSCIFHLNFIPICEGPQGLLVAMSITSLPLLLVMHSFCRYSLAVVLVSRACLPFQPVKSSNSNSGSMCARFLASTR